MSLDAPVWNAGCGSGGGINSVAVAVGRVASGSSKLQKFAFAPVETPSGSFSVYVEYQPAAMVHILEVRAGSFRLYR